MCLQGLVHSRYSVNDGWRQVLWRPEKAMAGLYLRGAETGVCVFPKHFDSEAVKRPQNGGKEGGGLGLWVE